MCAHVDRIIRGSSATSDETEGVKTENVSGPHLHLSVFLILMEKLTGDQQKVQKLMMSTGPLI